MSTYQLSTVRSRIQRKLDNTSFDSTTLNDFINDGQRWIFNHSRLTFNEREASVTTTASSTALTGLPTDISQPLNLRVYTPVNYAMLVPYVEYEDVDLIYPNVSLIGNGPPIAWTVFNGTPVLVNNADQTYTLKLKYIHSPTELINDTDVPEVPVEFSELLVLAGYKRALEHDDDFDQAQVIQQQIDREIIDMNGRYRRQAGVPHIMKQPKNLKRRIGLR